MLFGAHLDGPYDICVFEQLSGLKINFHKSEIFCYGEAKHYEQEYTTLFGCGIGSFPCKYLGIPMNHHKLHNADWSIIEEIQTQIKHLESQTLILWWKASLVEFSAKQPPYVHDVFL
jgi:hypothetical protein